MYKADNVSQYLCPAFPPQFSAHEERTMLQTWYMDAHLRLHSRVNAAGGSAASSSVQATQAGTLPRHKVLSEMRGAGLLVCLAGSDYELYALFGPLVELSTAMLCCTKLLRMIKKDEDSLFLLNVPRY